MILEAVRLAAGRLRANALRSMLTVLGLVIGVGSVVTLVAVGNGSAADVQDQFSRLGANTLTVTGGRGFGLGVAGLAGAAFSAAAASRSLRSRSLSHWRAASPVSASMRRTPAETALSEVIFSSWISPNARTCVPPHSSTE